MRQLIVAVCVLLGLSAFAQEGTTPNQKTIQQVEVNDQSIDRFANAVVKVEDLQKEFQSKLQSEDAEQLPQEKMQAVEQEFQAKAQEAIEKEGISVEQYSQYILLAQQDEGFRNKVIETIQSK